MLGDLTIKKILGKEIKLYNYNYIRKYYQVRNGLIIYKQYKGLVPSINLVAKFLINLLLTLPFEQDIFRKVKYIIWGFIDFLRNKTGRLES